LVALKLLLWNPERSKQQTRRFPTASIEQAFLIRHVRVVAIAMLLALGPLFLLKLFPMNEAEIQLGDLLIPWILAVGTIGFLLAWLVVTILEYTGLSRFIWHLPLFFVALVVLFTSLIGILFRP